MAYIIDLFSHETYETFTKSNQEISGFRQRQQTATSKSASADFHILRRGIYPPAMRYLDSFYYVL